MTDDPDLLTVAGNAATDLMTSGDAGVATTLLLLNGRGDELGGATFLEVRDRIADALGFHLAGLKAGAEAEILRRIDVATEGERKARELLLSNYGEVCAGRDALKHECRRLTAELAQAREEIAKLRGPRRHE